MTKVFVVNAEGSISVSEREAELPRLDSRLPQIKKKLSDGNFSAAEISRLISQEIALVIIEMQEYADDPTQRERLKAHAAEIRVLRALAKSVSKAPRNDDELNIDGPKLQHFLRRGFEIFEKAVRAALGKNSEGLVDKIMKNAHEGIEAFLQEIRLGEEISSSPAGDASQSDDATNGSGQFE